MKVVHLCLGCFFPDNYSYQENMLPKFHKQLGYDVEVIASLLTFDKDGKVAYMKKKPPYLNEYGVLVTRLEYRKPTKIYKILKRYQGTYEALEAATPDILFIHGCQFRDVDTVVKYLKKHSNVKVYVDNHADFSNSATNFLSKNILHKILWKHAAHALEPYTEKFYGVLPARVDFLRDIYGLSEEKVELLVMGADDDKVKEALTEGSRERIRKEYHIEPDEFLIMTGGKIDSAKRQTLLLMEAVKKMKNDKVKLIVFGSVTPELKEEVQALSDGVKVQYIGWVQSEESYKYWVAADLAVFPGRHSVFWEQVAGMGIPMVCKYWKGTTHVDVGGNVKFLKKDCVEEISEILKLIIEKDYKQMKKIAEGPGKQQFSYRQIASRSIQ